MISKAKSKWIKSLQLKKYRQEEQCFVVEGTKGVLDLLRSDFETVFLAGTQSFISDLPPGITGGAEVVKTSEKELGELGSFQTNNATLAVARMKANHEPVHRTGTFTILLDDIRDPGNMGTIIRTADWYGLKNIVSSAESADFYNPKVISATMGSFCRVNVFSADLPDYIKKQKAPVFGAFLDGNSVYDFNFGTGGLLVVGNESSGISREVAKLVTGRITIPRIGEAESLNASIATAIILDNIKRRSK